MSESQHFVVLIGAVADPGLAITSVIGAASLADRISEAVSSAGVPADVTVEIISWMPAGSLPAGVLRVTSVGAGPRPFTETVLARVGLIALRDRLASFPLGRLINSVGPADQSRLFDRAVRRNSVALAAISSAAVLIAADTAAVRVAWRSLRRSQVRRALFGVLPALAELSR